MKKVISKEEVKVLLKEAVDLLCNAVSSTLGPAGNNVLISNSDSSPFITNDGVTIAKNIESSDPKVNSILEIIKESSLKTDELVGDGTTTTLVLFQSIFYHGLEEIKRGKKATLLNQELKESLKKVCKAIEDKKIIPKKEDLESIASISANSEEIGGIVTDVFIKMNNKYSIQLEESLTEETYYKIKKGYNIEIDDISSMYFQNEKEIKLNNCSLFIIKGYLSNLEQISEIMNMGTRSGGNILILVEEMEDSIKQELLAYYLMEKKNIFIVKIPEYASRREKIELDISYLSGCVMKNIDYEPIYYMDHGKVPKIILKQNELVLEVNNNKTKELVSLLKEELKEVKNEYEKEFLERRISKLENGVATIYIGGLTKTEIKEKRMRYEDSLCSLEIAKKGILPGGGVSFLEISQKMKKDSSGDKILAKALEAPFEKMLENSGNTDKNIKKIIVDSNYQKIVNFKTLKLEDINKTKILDPSEVLLTAIKNAVSIATLLLSISYLVINENIHLEKSITL